MTVITSRSSKDEVITAACEIVDSQEAVIKNLTGEKNTLIFLVSVLSIIYCLF